MYHTNRTKGKNHIILLIDAGKKVFDKIQHPFRTKTLSQLAIERNFLNLITGILSNIILHGERLHAFPEDQEQDKDVRSHFYPTMHWRFQPGQ